MGATIGPMPDSPTDDPGGSEEKKLICGACEEVLEAGYEDAQSAQAAADEHGEREHPDRDEVVVVPVSAWLIEEEGAASMIEGAAGAQQRLDDGDVGESMMGL